MSNRFVPTLLALTAVMAIGEFASSIIIWVENYADAQPEFAVAFGVLFLVAVWLQRRGHLSVGAGLAGVLCLFEMVSYLSWPKPTTFDWVGDTVYVLIALATFTTTIAVFRGAVPRWPARLTEWRRLAPLTISRGRHEEGQERVSVSYDGP